jgi:hypothetical protein
MVGFEANHPRQSSSEVKNVWSYTSIPLYAFMVQRRSFTFALTRRDVCIHILQMCSVTFYVSVWPYVN